MVKKVSEENRRYLTLVGQDIPRSKCCGKVYAMEEQNGQRRVEDGELGRGNGKGE